MEDCKICKVCKESKPLSAFSDRFGGSGKLIKRTDCKACRALVEKERRANNPLAVKARNRSWYERNKEAAKNTAKQYQVNNPEKVKIYKKKSVQKRISNGKHSAMAAKYRAAKKKAVPKWANLDDIENVYIEAKYFKMEVDHIVPLQSDVVCGLHVWDNLQLLSPEENRRKRNLHYG